MWRWRTVLRRVRAPSGFWVMVFLRFNVDGVPCPIERRKLTFKHDSALGLRQYASGRRHHDVVLSQGGFSSIGSESVCLLDKRLVTTFSCRDTLRHLILKFKLMLEFVGNRIGCDAESTNKWVPGSNFNSVIRGDKANNAESTVAII